MKLRIRSNFEKSPHVEAIAAYVMEWLSENDQLLPMYFQPRETAQFTHDLKRNDMFREKKWKIGQFLSQLG